MIIDNKIIKIFIILLFTIFLNSCKDNKEDDTTNINRLLEDEKYETANTKIKEKLSTKQKEDEILSDKQTKEHHILELSNDRNRVVFTEEKSVIFRDLANPLVKQVTFGQLPVNLSISSDAEHALVSISLPNSAGCRIYAVSLLESKESYVSNSIIPCNHHGAITSDGTTIYYYIDDSLYMESTKEPKQPKLIIDKKNFPPPITNIKNRYYIYPIGKTFLIFAGNAGMYQVYWLDPKKNEEEKLLENVTLPKIFYGTGKNAYIVTGVIGELAIQELRFSAFGRPILAVKMQVDIEKTSPWPTMQANEFISGYEGEIFRWKEGDIIKTYPLLADRFWVAARDHIIYEDRNNELVISNLEFSEGDYKLLDQYRQTKKPKED
jgi:hypothetical protein